MNCVLWTLLGIADYNKVREREHQTHLGGLDPSAALVQFSALVM